MSLPATAILTSRAFSSATLAKVHSVYRDDSDVLHFTLLPIPPDVQTLLFRPSFVGIGRSTFILGMFSLPIVKLEDGKLYRVGIRTPPPPAPILPGSWNLTSGTGTTNHVGAIAFRHRMETSRGSLIMAESSMSRTDDAFDGDATRTWSNLPTTSPDSRVTHIVGYVSIAGGELEEAWEYPIGISTVTESQTVFGEVGSTLREPPPFCRYGEYFANSLWLGGDPLHQSRVYRSQQEEPESFDSATGFMDLPDGEVVTGMKRQGNVLLVFSERATYAISGFGILTGDYTIDKISPSVGTVSHHSLVNIDERIWLMAYEGVYMYDGQRFTYMMDDIRTFFREDLFSNLYAYRSCHAADNKITGMYELLIPKPGPDNHFSYCAFYLPMYTAGQPQPDWFFKTRPRYEYALGRLRAEADIPRLYTTDTVGFIRRDVAFGQTVDDDVPLNVVIQTRFEYGEGSVPTGDERTGKRWVGVDSYIRCDNAAFDSVLLEGYGGDESAIDGGPSFTATLDAGDVTGYVAKERYFRIPEALTGDGVSLRWVITNPAEHTKFKGYRLAWIPGEAARLHIPPTLRLLRGAPLRQTPLLRAPFIDPDIHKKLA